MHSNASFTTEIDTVGGQIGKDMASQVDPMPSPPPPPGPLPNLSWKTNCTMYSYNKGELTISPVLDFFIIPIPLRSIVQEIQKY